MLFTWGKKPALTPSSVLAISRFFLLSSPTCTLGELDHLSWTIYLYLYLFFFLFFLTIYLIEVRRGKAD